MFACAHFEGVSAFLWGSLAIRVSAAARDSRRPAGASFDRVRIYAYIVLMNIYEPRFTFQRWRSTVRTRYVVEFIAVVLLVAALILLLLDEKSLSLQTAVAGGALFAVARIISWARHGRRR